ncbi:Site-specific DNA recombinase [Altererythrobacter xiamenensis]|uniref:Site-specific DNA recombinase n=1 Tax=Altererythrobacter xiamenensis TaxID=1316679 RepID=A0A1Y6ESX5_9SPHN|nr:recombinase family protein [Altererythrobacter xiamenensis]SMQ64311.1 Site-specific DNA recombinase [Altererythrobacter xiamenensis]
MKTLRCAVYTRKSTEDGLEQEFNSLHAQREACEAYILSQRHEGWVLNERHYGDGGFSGGNMERPGLKGLMDDVEAGLVDVIVVYKVDRLTRSLADFAKIVERLDAKEASFVSVTQAFNTTNSMGRLTLNVLLSFAQFEREVTGERIRDKIAASKKKGLWMGGPVPLGYQVIDRKLIPAPEEAKRVRTIMRRYIASTSANELIEELKAEGILTKIQRRTSGPHRGGIPFKRGSLFHLLKNPVYRGKIVHKGKVYDGQHEAIVDEDLWEAVQARLKQKAPPRRRVTNDPQQAMLRGLLTDSEGRLMVPTYVTKGSRRYAYYETRKDLVKAGDAPATRWSRGSLDKHIVTSLSDLLGDQHALRRLSNIEDAGQLSAMFKKANLRKTELGNPATREAAIRSIGQAVQIKEGRIEIMIHPGALGLANEDPIRWSMSLPSRKPFREAKLRIDKESGQPKPDQRLVQLLIDAANAQTLILCSPELSLNQIGKREGRCRTQLAKLLRLSWLSPGIVEAILSGTQPSNLKRAQLLNCELPVDWIEQERLLGFAR